MTLSLSSLTPAEESAGAGAVVGLIAARLLLKKPNLTETAVGALVGGVVGYLGSQAWAAATASASNSSLTTTTSGSGTTTATVTSGSTDTSSTASGDTSQTPFDAGGGGSSF